MATKTKKRTTRTRLPSLKKFCDPEVWGESRKGNKWRKLVINGTEYTLTLFESRERNVHYCVAGPDGDKWFSKGHYNEDEAMEALHTALVAVHRSRF